MICLPPLLKFLTLIVCITGGVCGYLIRKPGFYFSNKSLNFYFFSYFNGSILFIPLISTTGLVYSPLLTGINALKSFDQGWSEYFGGQKIYYIIKNYSLINQFLQNNNLKIYLIIFVF